MNNNEIEDIERTERLGAASKRLRKALAQHEAAKGEEIWFEPKGQTLYSKRNYEVESMRRLDNARF